MWLFDTIKMQTIQQKAKSFRYETCIQLDNKAEFIQKE